NLDELTLEYPQSSGIQDQHMEDPLKDLKANQVELQKQQGQLAPYQAVQQDLPKNWTFKKDHPKDLIISDTSKGVTTRSSLRNIYNSLAFISQIEPSSIDEAINDESWVLVMQEELN
ncbi:hypothetical protein P3X46_002420, partial [Hevea brasiliensis]